MSDVVAAFGSITSLTRAETAPFAQLDLGDATSGVLRRELDAALDRIDATAADLIGKLKVGAKL